MDFKIDETIGFLVNRSAILIKQLVTEEFQKNGLHITPEEWIILNMLWIKNGQTQSEIADKTIRDSSTVTRMLDKLVKKAFVKRENDTKDRRIIRAYLLPKGKELKKQLIPCAKRVLDLATQSIPENELSTTKKTLRQIIKNLLEYHQND